MILVPRDEVGDGVVSHYVFLWPGTPDEQPMYALPTGLGMLFNHSPAANADFEPDPASLTILFRSIRPIERGEEILIDYDYAADHLEVLRHPQWYRAARNDSGSSDDQPLSS